MKIGKEPDLITAILFFRDWNIIGLLPESRFFSISHRMNLIPVDRQFIKKYQE